MADIVYRDGSIYHAVSRGEVFLVSLAVLLTSVLLMGLMSAWSLRQWRSALRFGFGGFPAPPASSMSTVGESRSREVAV